MCHRLCVFMLVFSMLSRQAVASQNLPSTCAPGALNGVPEHFLIWTGEDLASGPEVGFDGDLNSTQSWLGNRNPAPHLSALLGPLQCISYPAYVDGERRDWYDASYVYVPSAQRLVQMRIQTGAWYFTDQGSGDEPAPFHLTLTADQSPSLIIGEVSVDGPSNTAPETIVHMEGFDEDAPSFLNTVHTFVGNTSLSVPADRFAGELHLDYMSWTNAGRVTVGNDTSGLVYLWKSTLTSPEAVIGAGAMGNGDLTVDEATASFGQIIVGESGQGLLDIYAGGHLETRRAILGNLEGSYGKVNVHNGGSWNNQEDIVVGWVGEGELNIESGGSVATDSMTLVRGSTNVSGTGAALIVHDFANIGTFSAQLNVSSGGSLSVGRELIVSPHAQLTNQNGSITVGDYTPTLGKTTVGPNGTLNVHGGVLAAQSLLVDGGVMNQIDAAQTSVGDILIGDSHTSTLNITRGSRMNANTATLGRAAGVRGIVNVNTFNATWDILGTLAIGNQLGTGEVNVENGTVQVGNGLDVLTPGSLLNVRPGGLVTVQNPTTGTAQLKVWPGAQLRLDGGAIYADTVVFAPGSDIQLDGGVLAIQGGVFYSDVESLSIDGSYDGALPRISVSDAANGRTQQLIVGEYRLGRLDLAYSSELFSEAVQIGRFQGSRGEVGIGQDSVWRIHGNLGLGKDDFPTDASGRLDVDNASVLVGGFVDAFTPSSVITLANTAYMQADTQLKLWNGARLAMDNAQVTTPWLLLADGVLEGNGQVSGTIRNDGEVNVGTDHFGTLRVDGDFVQTALGELTVTLGGFVPSDTYDVLEVTGRADLAGDLDVTIINGMQPAEGYAFEILRYGSRSGFFSSITGLNLGDGTSFLPVYSANSLTLLVADHLPGDADLNGTVGLEDLNAVRNDFGFVGDGALGDLNLDGRVDLDDLNIVRNNFGNTTGPLFAAVPEPSTGILAILLAGAASIIGRRTKHYPKAKKSKSCPLQTKQLEHRQVMAGVCPLPESSTATIYSLPGQVAEQVSAPLHFGPTAKGRTLLSVSVDGNVPAFLSSNLGSANLEGLERNSGRAQMVFEGAASALQKKRFPLCAKVLIRRAMRSPTANRKRSSTGRPASAASARRKCTLHPFARRTKSARCSTYCPTSAETRTNDCHGTPGVILDNPSTKQKVVPTIVSLPNGRSGKDVTARDPIPKQAPAFAVFEQDLLQDLIPHIEKKYPVKADRKSRALAGLSMGGGQSLNFGLGNLDMFAWIGRFSSAPNAKRPAGLLTDPAEAAQKLSLLYISCGEHDGLLRISEGVHEKLEAKKSPHEYVIISGGRHDFAARESDLYRFAQRAFKESE